MNFNKKMVIKLNEKKGLWLCNIIETGIENNIQLEHFQFYSFGSVRKLHPIMI